MLPLYLSIEGLYSYQQKQEIDFTTLTEAGLFGIFGSVGSGKSSVLEAIGYALYGETERLNSKEKRTYNMLNLKSNQVLIDFQFLNFEGRKFRFIAQWRRKKKFQDITDHERNAYEWKDGEWTPLESNDGAAVTNLSYPNFKRTIIIPQGQFKEFLELKGKERSEMMKEIFFLNQYDLGPKVSYLMADNNKKIEHLKGALSGFEEVNKEIIHQKSEQFQNLIVNLDKQKKEFESIEIQYNSLQKAKQNKIDLEAKKEELHAFEQKKVQIQKIKKELLEYELVSNNFREHLNNLSHITSNKATLLTKIEGLKESKDAIKTDLTIVEQALEKLLPQYENLDTLKAEIQDFKKLIQNIESIQSKSDKEAGIIKGTEFLKNQKLAEEALANSIEQFETKIQNIKENKINAVDLLAIDSWYQKNEQISKELDDEKQRNNQLNLQIKELKKRFPELGYEESMWSSEIDSKLQLLESTESIIKNREGELRLKHELSQFVHNLHHGEPCPLCGSAEHPNPMQIETVDEEFLSLEKEQQELKLQKSLIENDKSELLVLSQMIASKQSDLEKYKHEIVRLEEQFEIHQSSFIWQDFDIKDRSIFDIKKAEVFKIEEQLTQLELELKNKREQIQKTRETILKSESKLNEYQNQINILDAQIKQNLNQIQVLDVHAFSGFDKNMLEEKFIANENNIKKIEEDYQEFSKRLLEYRTKYAQIKGAYTEAQEQHAVYTTKLQEIQNTLHKLLLEFNYPDIATIKSILDKNLNMNSLRNSIQDFYVAYQTLQNRIAELEILANEENYSDEKYEEVSKLIVLKKEELQLQIELYGALKDDLERLTIELAKKEELLSEYEKLNVRRDNLKILDNMFKGNGFVNYVSSIHLQRLCEIANHRFHRLTKNQLSLVINENNEFEVIDYLNNGYRRSAKTLSGGQAFQASLCLALALAENIQALNKADRNFFFIDEGFGTQDIESINTVFDTLQYLHQENRVVGIISHVEELKERMPRSITVVKDLDKGSQIMFN